MASRILLVDGPDSGRALRAVLRKDGHQVDLLADGNQAVEAVQAGRPDLLIAELLTPSVDGFGLLAAARAARPSVPVILISEYSTVETAVEALRRGAYHYFRKPLDFAAVCTAAGEALRDGEAPPGPAAAPGPKLPSPQADPHIVGTGEWLEQALDILGRVAPTRATVLLTGASGTGKEVFARAVHRMSGRKGSFVAVSCAALSRDLLESELFGHEKGAFTGAERRRQGRFEAADGGTLFLDEIGEVPLDLQVKLLRVLQEHRFERVGGTETISVDVRIVAATNRNLAAAIRERVFREDLYYRLKVIEISLPPLRERLHDIEPLALHFIHKHAQANGRPSLDLASEALWLLQRHPWPGNVRELENVIERAVALAGPAETVLGMPLLPPYLREGDHAPAPARETSPGTPAAGSGAASSATGASGSGGGAGPVAYARDRLYLPSAPAWRAR